MRGNEQGNAFVQKPGRIFNLLLIAPAVCSFPVPLLSGYLPAV